MDEVDELIPGVDVHCIRDSVSELDVCLPITRLISGDKWVGGFALDVVRLESSYGVPIPVNEPGARRPPDRGSTV